MWAPLLLTLALAAAPAQAEDPLEFSLVGVVVESVGLRETRLQLITEITRTRWPAVRLRSLEHAVSIGGRVVAEGEASYGGTRLRRDKPQEVRIPVSFRTLEAAGALGRGLVEGAKIDIEIEGAMRFRMLLIPFELPFDESLVDADLGI
jgi:hypothetical protein